MKKVEPEGPYNIAGYSFGAAVAFEMALQVQQNGGIVSQLILVDGSHSLMAEFTKSLKNSYMVSSTSSNQDLKKLKEEAFCTSILALFVTQLVKTQRKKVRAQTI